MVSPVLEKPSVAPSSSELLKEKVTPETIIPLKGGRTTKAKNSGSASPPQVLEGKEKDEESNEFEGNGSSVQPKLTAVVELKGGPNENLTKNKSKKRISWREEVVVNEVDCSGDYSEDEGPRLSVIQESATQPNRAPACFQGIETTSAEDEYYKNLYNTGETDEEFYHRIFMDWDLQDNLSKGKSSVVSAFFLFPIMMFLKFTQAIVRILFTAVNSFISPPDQEDTGLFSSFYRSLLQLQRLEDVPFEQRKQAGMVFFFIMLLPMIGGATFLTVLFLLFPLTTVPMAVYLGFIYFYDKSPEDGSRVAFVRYWSVWRHFVNYFPIRLVKTFNLDPNEKYVLCYHPHGIISFGAFGNFGTDATGFSRLFPGINLRLLTLTQNFLVPWLRELLLSMGICSCSKKSCNKNLQKGPGSAIMLVVGGADESLLAAPGTYRLNVNGRKGFVRVAIDNGANLVPVLGFGENDAFTTQIFEKGSFVRNIQEEFKKRFGFATPIFWGRDTSDEDTFGIMPHRTPIIAVVGKPLKCPQVPAHLKGHKLRSTPEGRALVNKYHQEYIKALKALYDAFKDRWAINRSESMLLVGRRTSSLAEAVRRKTKSE